MQAYEHDWWCIEKYGCTAEKLCAYTRLARTRYLAQKYGAGRRGIGWEISLPEWFGVWESSGKWSERGPGPFMYAMGRKGDVGPYAVWNVYICTNHQNRKDLHVNKPEIHGKRTRTPPPPVQKRVHEVEPTRRFLLDVELGDDCEVEIINPPHMRKWRTRQIALASHDLAHAVEDHAGA